MKQGRHNLITDVAGLRVGNTTDHDLKSGVTVLICDEPATAAVHVMGGAPGTRETDLLSPENTVQQIDALVLSGGSAFGLDAASGVQAALREAGRGFAVGPIRVPIVPAAILFDLLNGGNKQWGRYSPYRDMGYDAAIAADERFALGSCGAGTGATTAGLKGGLGSASTILPNGTTIGALVAVNALGSATIGDSSHFRAATFELDGEFGNLGLPSFVPLKSSAIRTKLDLALPEEGNTTIGIIATDATLTKAEAKRLAVSAHDGFANALWPSHTPLDGDLVFSVSTARKPSPDDTASFIALCAAASATMARAIARGVFEAHASTNDIMPTWKERFE